MNHYVVKTCVCVCVFVCSISLVSSFHPSSLSFRIKHVYQLSLHLASSSQHARLLIESLNNRYSSGSVCVCVCKGRWGGEVGGVVCKHDDALGCLQCTCQICLLIYDACVLTHVHRRVLAVAGGTMCQSRLGASPVLTLATGRLILVCA